MSVSPDEDRKRGRIEARDANLRVVVYAGLDPVTGRRSYLRETVKGNDKAARKQANKVMTRLLAEVDRQRTTESSVPLAHVIDEWLRVAELEDGTREMYRGYLDRNIRPVLGDTPAKKLTAGAQLTFTDADGHRITAIITDIPDKVIPGQTAGLELNHRQHARVEDRIREAKNTGLRNLPCRGFAENTAWLHTLSPFHPVVAS